MLTPREEQIVNLVAEGIGNRDIGEQLGIKENTVKKSLLRTYDKLGVSNRVELVLYALTHRASETSAPPSPKRAPLSCQPPLTSIRLSLPGVWYGEIPISEKRRTACPPSRSFATPEEVLEFL